MIVIVTFTFCPCANLSLCVQSKVCKTASLKNKFNISQRKTNNFEGKAHSKNTQYYKVYNKQKTNLKNIKNSE